MGAEKAQRAMYARYGLREHVQTITCSGGLQATEANAYGTTIIVGGTTGAGNTVTLAAPSKGVRKTFSVTGPGASSVPVTLQTHSSACVIGNTTKNTLVFSTTITDPVGIELIGSSSAAWALITNLPSGVTLAAATKL